MTVDEVLQLIPEEQRDEAKQAIEGLNPLSSVQDADSALRLIEENDVLRRAKDKIAQQAVESHKRKFEEEKLPELQKQWKDEVRKELQPEETAEQKRLRELEETLKERDKREQMYQTKEKLRARAKEVGVDEDIAERFVNMNTDDPVAELDTFAERFKETLEQRTTEEINKRWPNRAPKTQPGSGGKITSMDQIPKDWTRDDYAAAVEAGQIDFG